MGLSLIHISKAGHPGGSLSAADIFTYLYFEELNIDPKNPKIDVYKRQVLEESEMEPFVEEVEGFAAGKKIALFGSYGWGDGQWMRDW